MAPNWDESARTLAKVFMGLDEKATEQTIVVIGVDKYDNGRMFYLTHFAGDEALAKRAIIDLAQKMHQERPQKGEHGGAVKEIEEVVTMVNDLARTLTGYAYIVRDMSGRKIGLAYAPPEAAEGLSEEEKKRLPLVTLRGDVVEAVPEGQSTDFLPPAIQGMKCWCGGEIDPNNCVILVEDGKPQFFCCGECYR